MTRANRPPASSPGPRPGGRRFALALGGILAGAWAGGLALCATAPVRAEAVTPLARIASLNLCGDELLLRLVDRDRIASITFLAADPAMSNVPDLARGLPLNRGLAEEVIPLRPDLVITGAFTTRATTDLLRMLGVPVLELPMPETLDQAYAQIRQVAARVGEPGRGEAMVARLKADLAALPAPQGPQRSAIVLRPNGFTAGKGSLADDLMARAGLRNLAARLPTDRLGQLPLEEIVVAHPDLLIIDSAPGATPSLAQSMLDHPALSALHREGRTVSLPARLWACPGPNLAEAAQRLAHAPRSPAPQALAPARAPAAGP